MTIQVRNFLSCERFEFTEYFTLHNIRFDWPEPPDEVPFWLNILNPSESDVSVMLELYRGRELVDYTEEELLPPSLPSIETVLTLQTTDMQKKSYTVVAVINGFAAAKLGLDFGAPNA